MASLESASFKMEVSGAPVQIEGLEFASAKGNYSTPASAAAVLEMRFGTATVEMSTISIDDRTWLTDPLSGNWSELPPGLGFNPAIVFGPEGWAAMLTTDLGGTDDDERGGNYLLTGSVAAERVDLLTAGIVADQQVEIELVVDSETFHVLTADFSTTADEGITDWHIELGSFDGVVTINAPASV